MTDKPPPSWLVEYEIPPLRAVYFVICDYCANKREVQKFLKIKHPEYRIRKITKHLEDKKDDR